MLVVIFISNLMRHLACDLSRRMVPCALEKNVNPTALGWNILRVSIKFTRSNILSISPMFPYWFSAWMSIDVNGILRSPTINVWLSITPFMSVNICFMYSGWVCMSSAYIFIMVLSSSWIDPFIVMHCLSLLLLLF